VRRPRRTGPWLLAFLLVALAGVGVVVAAGALRGKEARVPPDAGVTVVTIAPDAGPTVVPLAPDATPADAAAAPLALASLDVITTPAGAKVQLAGREAPPQTSPASFLDLEPGDVAVHVTLDGHEPLDRDVTLAPGERRTLELALIKKEVPRDRPPRDRDRDRRPAMGTLNVRTTPYSVVTSGGKKLGETPFVIQLPAGSYTLTFKNPEHGTTTRKVTIRAGETTKLKFDL
jgi:serine/threonine-protein kinase